MTIDLSLPLFLSVASINFAIAAGRRFGFRFAGTGPGALSGVKPILAIRDSSDESEVEVQFMMLGKASWLRIARDRVEEIAA